MSRVRKYVYMCLCIENYLTHLAQVINEPGFQQIKESNIP